VKHLPLTERSVPLRFPPTRALPPLSPELAQCGIELSAATQAALPQLRALFADSRMADLALTPWTREEKRAFLDRQFTLQHQHFAKVHGRGDFRLIQQAEQIVGRFYFDRSGTDWILVDILLAAPLRGAGIGGALIDWLQREAARAGAAKVLLSVAHDNPRAQRLYSRRGFTETEAVAATHARMEWHA